MRVVQGFGGAMMTPVGRLILLRSFPRASLVSAMNWMTIPAMIGPTVGPIVGGLLTNYASWRWIFYLNIPIGRRSAALLALWLFENFRAPAPTRFDIVGFLIAGVGLFLFEFAIENLGRPMIAPWVGLAVLSRWRSAIFCLYAATRGTATRRCSTSACCKIKTFRIGTVIGGLCRMGLDATPFMLPLLFQVGFGLSPMQAGLADLFLDPGRDGGAHASRGRCCAGSGSAARWSSARCLSAAVTAELRPAGPPTPRPGSSSPAVLISGCVRSIQYLALNTISFADVPSPLLSRSTSVSGVVQQLARGFGVAIGAALLAIVAGGEHGRRSAISASSSC